MNNSIYLQNITNHKIITYYNTIQQQKQKKKNNMMDNYQIIKIIEKLLIK